MFHMFRVLSNMFMGCVEHSKLDLIIKSKHITTHTIFLNTYEEVLYSLTQHIEENVSQFPLPSLRIICYDLHNHFAGDS